MVVILYNQLMKSVLPPPYDISYGFIEENLSFICIPKCGSTSLRASMVNAKYRIPMSSASEYSTRIAVIRDPATRIYSAWRSKWPEHSFGEFWEHTASNPKFDIHTHPYAEWLGDVPTEVYRIEDSQKWWPPLHVRFPHRLYGELSHRNISGVRAPDLAVAREIREVYAEDYAMWLNAA